MCDQRFWHDPINGTSGSWGQEAMQPGQSKELGGSMILEVANEVLPASLLPYPPLHPLLAEHYKQTNVPFDITVIWFILLLLHQTPCKPLRPFQSVETLSA